MTIVIGYGNGDNAWMGIDAITENGGFRVNSFSKRVWRKKINHYRSASQSATRKTLMEFSPLLIACCGLNTLNLELADWNPPDISIPTDEMTPDEIHKYSRKVARSIRSLFFGADWWPTVKDPDSDAELIDGLFMFACFGQVFMLASDFAVMNDGDRGWLTIGSGAGFCDGALSVLTADGRMNDDPPGSILRTMELCSQSINGIAGPYQLESLKES